MTPKERMLAAYRGMPADRIPFAPEFWYYYPAKLLGVPMSEVELEIPFWAALKRTFEYYQTDGWGIASPKIYFPEIEENRCVSKGNGIFMYKQ